MTWKKYQMIGAATIYGFNLLLDNQRVITTCTAYSSLQCKGYVTSENLYTEFQLLCRANHQLKDTRISDLENIIVHEMLPLGVEPFTLRLTSITYHLPLLAITHENSRYLLARNKVINFGW